MTAVSQQYLQLAMPYLGAKWLNMSWGRACVCVCVCMCLWVYVCFCVWVGVGWEEGRLYFQQLFLTVTRLNCGTMAEKIKLKQNPNKQKTQTWLCWPRQTKQQTTDDISFRRATSDCIVFNLRELESFYSILPLFLSATVVLTRCQTCVLNSPSWPWRWVDPLRTLSSEGRCSDGSLFDTCLEGSEVVLQNRDSGHKSGQPT